VGPSSLADPGFGNRSLNGILVAGPDGGTIQNNLISSVGQFGIFLTNDADNWTIHRNEFRENGYEGSGRDGIDIGNLSGGTTITENYFLGNFGGGVDSWRGDGGNIIRNNTFDGNGPGGAETFAVRLFGTGSTVEYNLINNSTGAGVLVAADDQWSGGTNDPSTGNLISKNSFDGNGGPSIDLVMDVPGAGFANTNQGDGATANDGLTDPASANIAVDYPVVTGANKAGSTTTVDGTAATGVTSVEVYKATAAPGFGEGTQYLGTAAVAGGLWSLAFVDGTVTLNIGEYVSVIGIDASNNTSEFGQNFVVSGGNANPVLVNNGPLNINEGTTTILDNTLLQVTDADNTPDQIVYTLTAHPGRGALRLSGDHIDIGETFTQDDIDNNRVVYEHRRVSTSISRRSTTRRSTRYRYRR
jgi:parallel beta-helix repeat protein